MTEHLTSNLVNLFQLSPLTNSRVRTISRSELSLAKRQETAFGVIWECASAGGEDGSFDRGEVLRWGEEDEFVALKGRRGHFWEAM